MARVDAEHGLAQAQEAGVGVLRVPALSWETVEPVRTEPPTYLWDKMSGLDQQLADAARAGIQVTLIVMFTPEWARQVPSRNCSAIKEEAFGPFAQFLQAAVARYSQSPYNIHRWELYNEPDVDPALVSTWSAYGCWGDANDPFYGGRTFGRMLQAAYPAIKKADRKAVVIVGGLLLDAPDTLPSNFLAGILEAGAGSSFDLLAYHAYTYYFASAPEADRRPDQPWSALGVVAGKAQFLRDVMAQYGVSRPLVLNEAGYGWYGSRPPPAEFPDFQADYVAKLYARGLALGLESVIWYGWEAPGWRHMALLNDDLSPRPGAQALALAVRQLTGAEYTGPAAYEGVEGYAFRRKSDRLQVLWSADYQPHTVRVPLQELRTALDSVGQPVSHTEQSGQAVFTVVRPVVLVLAP